MTDDKLDKALKKLEKKLVKENNIDELNSIVDLFNVNLQKKNIIRSAKLSEAQDLVVDQMLGRLKLEPEEITDDNLIKYHKAIQDTLNRSDTTMDNIKAPNIQINQQVNVDKMVFDSEARKRILSAVNGILNGDISLDNEEGEE